MLQFKSDSAELGFTFFRWPTSSQTRTVARLLRGPFHRDRCGFLGLSVGDRGSCSHNDRRARLELPVSALDRFQRAEVVVLEQQVRDLINGHITGRDLGIFGEPRVNVLKLNIALDAAAPLKS